MNFELTKEQEMIRKEVRKFAKGKIAPRAEEMEKTGEYPYDLIEEMADLGLMGIPFPEQYGGSGGDWVGMHIAIEEISRADITLGTLLDVTTSIVAQEIYEFGSEEQKQKWLVPLAKGETLGAFGLTEPDSGSDARSLATTAKRDGDDWVLNGTKQFITNIGLDSCSVVLIAARTEDGGISAFIVPKDSPGFEVGERYEKMSWKASATHEIILKDCRVPHENLLGDPKKGFAQHLTALETGRISIAAIAVGLAQACLDEAYAYARGRKQFGRPIFDYQAIQFKLVDMAVSIELARNQYLKAAWLKDRGKRNTFEACTAKLYASEIAEKAASEALQIHGGYGYMDEYPVSRYYKMAKLLQIVEGTSEVQRLVIGRHLGERVKR